MIVAIVWCIATTYCFYKALSLPPFTPSYVEFLWIMAFTVLFVTLPVVLFA